MIAVLDYGIGNLRSAEKALQHVGGDARLVADPDEAAAADGVVLPGVGAFGPCARALTSSGLRAVVDEAVATSLPFLGICVGFQLLHEGSDEDPGVAGLGVLPGVVRRLPEGPKSPQMQWNVLEPVGEPTGVLADLPQPPWVYFVHAFAPERTAATTAVCDYGGPVVAAAGRGAVSGVQFHPEKSGAAGLALLANFVRLVEERTTAGDSVSGVGG